MDKVSKFIPKNYRGKYWKEYSNLKHKNISFEEFCQEKVNEVKKVIENGI